MKSRLLIIIGIVVFSLLIIPDSFELEKVYARGESPPISHNELYEFIDFSYTYEMGDPIQFVVEKIAYTN